MYKVFAVVLISIFYIKLYYKDGPVLNIKQGALKGRIDKTYLGRHFFSFTGIPYAKPPLGNLRFKAPIPASAWQGTFDASKVHNVCPQIDIYSKDFPIIGNEDCLFLNIYTPQLPNSETSLLPVLFYIHGGAFILGSARPDWIGPEILLDKDVVLVTSNYRLGALGFLSTLDSIVPGNNGLKDQYIALNWVRNNIQNFGGDPNKITVFGNSAGGVSAHYHTLSPLSKDLLSGAIIQSGFAVSSWALSSKEEAIKNAMQLGKFMKCPTLSNQDLVKCLRNASVVDIITQETKFSAWDGDTTIPFRPVIESTNENAFLSENPTKIIQSGNAANIPIMSGIVEQEGAFKSSAILENERTLKLFNADFNAVVTQSFNITFEMDEGAKAIKKFYFENNEIDSSKKIELTNMYTDGWFLWDLNKTVRLHFAHSTKNIYKYLFGYRGSETYASHFSTLNYDYGVCHTDELLYLLNRQSLFSNYKPTENDLRIRNIMATLWTNFATTGNPTPKEDSIILTKWQPVRSNNQEYYHIKDYDDLVMSSNLFENRTEFWKGLLTRESKRED